MSVLNPRNRLVNFRLSEAELSELKAACHERGARSISEFAREAVLGALKSSPGGGETGAERVGNIERKIDDLEFRVDQLLRLMALTGTASGERRYSTQSRPAGGELSRL